MAGLIGLFVVIAFHSPRWWLLAHESPGSNEWTRGLAYFKQCLDPARTDIEPAMRWRFIPQIFVYALGGSRWLATAFSWVGAWALLAYIYSWIKRSASSEKVAMSAMLLLGATSPVLVSTHWLGINDAWVALGLCYLAFGQAKIGLVAACALCPFIDERFIFGAPLAVTLRSLEQLKAEPKKAMVAIAWKTAAACSVFGMGRLVGIGLGRGTSGDSSFILASIGSSTSYLFAAPLGAWMALRFAAFPPALEIVEIYKTNRTAMIVLLAAAIGPVCVGFMLAADTMRTAGILLPLCLWGARELLSEKREHYFGALALAMLVVPAAHVSYRTAMVINSLPFELYRILR